MSNRNGFRPNGGPNDEEMGGEFTEENTSIEYPDAISVEERVTSTGTRFTVIKREKHTELIVPVRDPRTGEVIHTARVMLEPWATDTRKAPDHVKDDIARVFLEGYKNYMMELEKDPVKKAEFEERVREMKNKHKKK